METLSFCLWSPIWLQVGVVSLVLASAQDCTRAWGAWGTMSLLLGHVISPWLGPKSSPGVDCP